jgi:hypothetical protein
VSVGTYLLAIAAGIVSTVVGVLAFVGVASDRAQSGLGGGVSDRTDEISENSEA